MSETTLILKIGAMGDLLMASPALRAFRKSFPERRIVFAVGRSNRRVLDNCPHVDDIITVDDAAIYQGGAVRKLIGTLGLVCSLRSVRANEIFVLQRDWRWNLIARLSGARDRYGFARDAGGRFLTHSVLTSPETHEIDKYLQVMALRPGFRSDGRSMEVYPSDEDREFVRRLLTPLSGRTLVALAPGGASNVKEKRDLSRWPIERYMELTDRLLAETNVSIVFTGGPSDRVFTEQLPMCADRTIDLAGATSIQQSALLLAECAVLVTHDCGPMHLGAVAGIPVVSLFGPTEPAEKAPQGQPMSTVLWPGRDLPCAPCYRDGHFPDCLERECMNRIGVDDVMNAMRQILNA